MAVSIVIIAVVSYGLSLVDVCSLVPRIFFKEELPGRADYFGLYRRYRWIGVGYALACDLLRALIAVLIGGFLMKGAGFPSVGKLAAFLFAMMGQALPLLPAKNRMTPRQELIFPAIMLLLADWRVFLAAAVVAVVILALTGNRTLMAAGAAVMIPVGTLIFGGGLLKVVMALLSCAALIYCYSGELPEALRGRGKKKTRTPKGAGPDADAGKGEDGEE